MRVKQNDLTIQDIMHHADELWLLFRYSDGKPVCPYCGHQTKQYVCKDGRYKCNHCNHRYSSRVGTVFHNTKLTTKQIMLGLYLVLSQPTISGLTLARQVGITYNASWAFLKRVQVATEQTDVLTGVVAVDEVYLGGKWKYIHFKRKLQILRGLGLIGDSDFHFTQSQALQGIDRYKHPVFGGNDGHRIFLLQMPCDFDKECIMEAYNAHTANVTTCVTDDSSLYTNWKDAHEVNNHSKHKYRSEGGHSSNPIEGTFGHYRTMFRCGYVHCDEKYVQLYLNLFVFKWNNRNNTFYNMLANMVGCIKRKRCRYKDIMA
ncbi:MAG: IS1595 family transposase [Paludibacteraceae bacterium]|nr:IS1595 family transposase [Paludibacteraceae bacterium]